MTKAMSQLPPNAASFSRDEFAKSSTEIRAGQKGLSIFRGGSQRNGAKAALRQRVGHRHDVQGFMDGIACNSVSELEGEALLG